MPVVILHSDASLGGPRGWRGVSPGCQPGRSAPPPPLPTPLIGGKERHLTCLYVQFIVESNSAMGGRGSALGGGL